MPCVTVGSRSATRSMSSTPLDSPTRPLPEVLMTTLAARMFGASMVTFVSVTSLSRPSLTL